MKYWIALGVVCLLVCEEIGYYLDYSEPRESQDFARFSRGNTTRVETINQRHLSSRMFQLNTDHIHFPLFPSSSSSNMTRLSLGLVSRQVSTQGPTNPSKTTVILLAITRGEDTIPLGTLRWESHNATENTQPDVMVGDLLHFLVVARDSEGHQRLTGGDYWHAVFTNENKMFSSVGRVVDHENGQYTILFLAAWRGKVQLKLTLVHPADISKWIKTDYLHTMKQRSWTGVFQQGRTRETSQCYLDYSGSWINMCTVLPGDVLRYSRLICHPPDTLPCDTLVAYSSSPNNSKVADKRLRDKIATFSKSPFLFKKVQDAPVGIVISRNPDLGDLLYEKSFLLPYCKPDLPRPLSEGYWLNRTWHSLTCGPRVDLTRPSVQQCLRNSNIYVTGDSTTRQWFAALCNSLGIGRQEDHMVKFLLTRQETTANINLTFNFHPLSTHGSIVKLSNVKFEHDVIAQLPRHTCRHVVVISPYMHFSQWHWEAYVDWLSGIRSAILEARKRCPDLLVIAKSPHPTFYKNTILMSNFIYDQMRGLYWEMFEGIGAVAVIDIWDLNLSSPWPLQIHMPTEVINQEISLFLSYVCPHLENIT